MCVSVKFSPSCLVSVSNIMEVYLNSSGPVQALKGERLVLNCTATGELNTRVNITWDYPGKVRPALKSVETNVQTVLQTTEYGERRCFRNHKCACTNIRCRMVNVVK